MAETKLDRRGFLAGAAGLTGVALSVGAWKPVFAMESAGGLREAVGVQGNVKVGRIALTLDESPAGFLSSAEGGNATSDVVTEKIGPDFLSKKHLAGVKYEDVTINCGTGMSKTFYEWIKDSFSGRAPSHSGAIAGVDFNFKVFTQTNFFNALITEVGFPALDAASKDSAKMTVKFSPQRTRLNPTGGGSVARTSTVQQKWLVSNFKLTINGMDTRFVSKVDALNVKWNFLTSPEDQFFRALHSIDIPNVKLTVAEAHAKDFFSWHQDFVINGNNSSENEKTGSLSFLSSDLKTELFRLNFSGLGIFALDPDPLTLSSSLVRNVTAQLYCDKWVFNFKL